MNNSNKFNHQSICLPRLVMKQWTSLAAIASFLVLIVGNLEGGQVLAQSQPDSYRIVQGSSYVISVPPGKTVEIILPAVCLDYSKDIPSANSSFSSSPQNATPELRRLLELHDRMLIQQEDYKRSMKQISSLQILTIETRQIRMPDGKIETVDLPFKTALDEAFQYAIWENDPAFIQSWQKQKEEREQEKSEFDAQMRESQQVIAQLRATGVDSSLVAELQQLIDGAKLMMAEADWQLKWMNGVETLAHLMRQAVGAEPVQRISNRP